MLQKSKSNEHCTNTDDDFITLSDDRLQRFQAAIRFDTVSFSQESLSLNETLSMHTFLEKGNSIFIYVLVVMCC